MATGYMTVFSDAMIFPGPDELAKTLFSSWQNANGHGVAHGGDCQP